MIKTHESVAIEIERCLKKLIYKQQQFALELVSHPNLDHFLNHHDKGILENSRKMECRSEI